MHLSGLIGIARLILQFYLHWRNASEIILGSLNCSFNSRVIHVDGNEFLLTFNWL